MEGCPTLSRAEKLILRASESKVLFEDRFVDSPGHNEVVTIGDVPNGRDGEVEDLGEMMEAHSIDQHNVDAGEAGLVSVGGGSYIAPSAMSSASNADWSPEESSNASRSKGSIASRLRKSSRVSLRDSESSRNTSPATQVFQQSQTTPPHQLQQNALGIGRPRAPSTRGGMGQIPGGVSQLRSVNKRDTHFFDTSANFKGLNIPIRIPLSTFEEEVGDVSDVAGMFRTGWLMLALSLVLSHQPRQDIQSFEFDTISRSLPSSPAHEWSLHTSYHLAHECFAHSEADHLPRAWSAGWQGSQSRPCYLRSHRTSASWIHRASIPILQPRWAGYAGRNAWFHCWCHESSIRRITNAVGRALQYGDWKNHGIQGDRQGGDAIHAFQ